MPIRYTVSSAGGDSGGGGAFHRFTKSADLELAAGAEMRIVPATDAPVRREVFVVADAPIALRWEGSDRAIGMEAGNYLDNSDGGLALYATSDTAQTVVVWVRSETAIDYELGGDVAVDLILKPLAEAGAGFLSLPAGVTAPMSTDLESSYSQIWNDEGGDTAGSKVWIFDTFQLGAHYDFTIAPDPAAGVGSGRSIQIFHVPTAIALQAAWQFSAIAYDIRSGGVPADLIAFVKGNSWAAKVDATGGSFTLTPGMGRLAVLFDCENSSTGTPDTCITTYAPNAADPKQGGTFTIVGF